MTNSDWFNRGAKNNERNDVYRLDFSFSGDKDAKTSFQYRSFTCPYCRARISVTKNDVAKVIVCPDCGVKVAVPALDFVHETEYQHRYYNREKILNDEKYSPIRNPNRVGIKMDGNDVYQVRELDSTPAGNSARQEYIPLQCALCNTLINVPSFMLGKVAICPDCGSEIKVRRPSNAVVSEKFSTISVEERTRRDEILSPVRNPKRQGLVIEGDHVYNVKDDLSVEERGSAYKVFIPIRCHICGALAHVPEAMLGQRVICHDCGRATIVTNSFKEHEDTINVRFQPELLEGYGIVKESSSSVVYHEKDKCPALQKRRDYVDKQQDSTNGDVELSKINRVKQLKNKRKKENKSTEDNESLLAPQMVLRHKNGELVWAQPSPPKQNPLFTKTFSVIKDGEIWFRLSTIVFGALGVILISLLCLRLATSLTDLGVMILIFLYALCCPVVLLISALLGIYFWSIFQAGCTGVRRVVEWRSEDISGGILYGLWFVLFLTLTCVPGILLSNIIEHMFEFEALSNSIFASLTSEICVLGSCVFFFPIFWLSTQETGYIFCPCTGYVFKSFFSKFVSWFEFYCCSFFTLFIPGVVLLTLLQIHTAFIFLAPIIIGIETVFYALLLGRLAWIVEDEVRSREYDD